ncbi:hypothetical protein V8B97DRAFT_1920591 [Scleroderma yunnanense]
MPYEVINSSSIQQSRRQESRMNFCRVYCFSQELDFNSNGPTWVDSREGEKEDSPAFRRCLGCITSTGIDARENHIVLDIFENTFSGSNVTELWPRTEHVWNLMLNDLERVGRLSDLLGLASVYKLSSLSTPFLEGHHVIFFASYPFILELSYFKHVSPPSSPSWGHSVRKQANAIDIMTVPTSETMDTEVVMTITNREESLKE